jgi:hypothetical protein
MSEYSSEPRPNGTAQQPTFNTSSGAMLVDLSGEMVVDTLTIDTDPITGEGAAAKSLADVVAALAPLATAARQPATGTAGTPASEVATVQGISNGTPVPVSGAFALEAGNLAALLAATLAANASTVRASSGTSPIATATNSAVTALAADAVNTYYHVRICNESAAPGFYSIDGGTTWSRLPASSVIKNDGVAIVNTAIQVKRVADGTNLSGVYVEVW